MKTRSFSRGFTLIELLVVIAIIGILTSVVLASLNSARTKGGDASVKSNLDGIRSQAELYYDNAKNYGTAGTTCADSANVTGDANVKAAVENAVSNGGGVAKCKVTATSYAIAVPLKSNSANFWCVDSGGFATSTLGVAGDPISAAARCQ